MKKPYVPAVSVFLFLFNSTALLSQSKVFENEAMPKNQAFGLALSKDHQKLLFVKSFGGRDTMSIYEADFIKNKWARSTRAPFSIQPGKVKDIDPFFSPKGDLVLFNSNRQSVDSTVKDFDIWAVTWKKGKWGEPYRLEGPINSGNSDFYATMTSKEVIYFTSDRPGGIGKHDIYRSSFRNGKYEKPELLPSPINTDGEESNPYISPEEDFLIFVSSTREGLGDSDLYISFNRKGKWSVPQNLGNEVNTAHAEFAPYYDKKSGLLYFGRIIRGKPLVENIYSYELPLKSLMQSAKF